MCDAAPMLFWPAPTGSDCFNCLLHTNVCLEHFICSDYAARRAAVLLHRDEDGRDEEKELETLSKGEIMLVSLLESELSTLTLFILLYYDCTDPPTWFQSRVGSAPL
jgi:hypothetical protein